ncbi:YlbD family protein [Pontibacillus marinus]|uniref:Coat protein n=1 Tax=Pontibacillus marinus BH030004 = DSM 16465 TaxID=1385511 RepID=A0A0A5FZ33_9BACI|nr:YlbD family protein [Pontibacillus marinus]KGX84070.1 hypothetical protein N783_19295 [Pontibacillus marinus BH030004 = DSM 16465]
MSGNDLHPSVQQFKEFVNKHPKLVKEVKDQGSSWQPFYEKWVLLGEEDSFWDPYREEVVQTKRREENKEEEPSESNNQEFMGQLMSMVDKVDLNKVQEHIQQLNGAVQNIQSLVGQFQDMKKQLPGKNQARSQRRSPFSFGRD